nr:hypothetical protein [Tanacetum cinerariifolium]
MQKIIKEQVKQQVKVQVSKILAKIEQTVNEQLEAEVLTRSSNSSKTSYAALFEAYKSNKIILDTYGDTVMLKRRHDDDADKDEEPSAGSDQGSKRRREGKEPKSTSAPKEKATRSAGKSTQGTKSQQTSASESATIEEPISIVIQRRVEDLQLSVESYQKKLNLTNLDTYRSDLKGNEAYIAYSNLRGFIYQNKDKQNRLMRIEELHKFSNGTLTNVRTALDDRLKGIWIKYLLQSIWRKNDKDRVAAMIQAIDKQLKTKRIMGSLERFIRGRLYQAKEGPTDFTLIAHLSLGLSSLDTKLEESLKEKDDLKLKLEKFETSSRNLTNLINSQISPKDKTGCGYDGQLIERDLNNIYMNKSKVFESASNSSVYESEKDNNQVNDRYKAGEGYHAVPPPYTRNFMPPRHDLSFAGLDDFVFKSTMSETITSVHETETSASKSRKESMEKPKTVRFSAHIIED